MDDNRRYEAFVRNRITELREQKGVSEHRMSLELGKSGSYIRSITNGISMPSLRELFNIMEYFRFDANSFLCSYGRSGFPAWDHRQEAACPAG